VGESLAPFSREGCGRFAPDANEFATSMNESNPRSSGARDRPGLSPSRGSRSPDRGRLSYSRRERKVPLAAARWMNILSCAERHLPVERFDGVHDLVSIKTTYLDTADLAIFREYEERKPVRTKVRVRQYGYHGVFDARSWVEIKIKRRLESDKRRFCCSAELLTDLMRGADLAEHVRGLNSGSDEAVRIFQEAQGLIVGRGLRPVVRVEYERMSFQDGSSSEARVTVDRNVRLAPASGTTATEYEGIILEIKYRRPAPDSIRRLWTELNVTRSRRFSKFAEAIQAVRLNESRWRFSA